MLAKTARELALISLISVVKDGKSLSAFSFTLNNQSQPLAQALSYGVCRFYFHLIDVVNAQLHKPLRPKDTDVMCILLLGAYEILYRNSAKHAAVFENVQLTQFINKSWAKKMLNAVLRNISRCQDSIKQTNHHAHPLWLLKHLKKQYPEHWQHIIEANNQQAPMTLRIHSKYPLSRYQQHLAQLNINAQPCNIANAAPQALILEKAQDITLLPDFDNGACFVQDGAAQLAAHLISRNNHQRILDACAAPGGKTTHLAELNPQAIITALDNNPQRLERLAANCLRYQINNTNIICGSAEEKNWWDGIRFDAIVLDAPCSATGVIRRHPDIKLLRRETDIEQLARIQQAMLTNLWQMLAPGGELLYVTCSVLQQENEAQIKRFIDTTQEARHVAILENINNKLTSYGVQILPQYQMDGFFYAKLRKEKIVTT